jgi:hypothetical protein
MLSPNGELIYRYDRSLLQLGTKFFPGLDSNGQLTPKFKLLLQIKLYKVGLLCEF